MRFKFSHILAVLVFVFSLSAWADALEKERILEAARRWVSQNTIFQKENPTAVPTRASRYQDDSKAELPLWLVELEPDGYLLMGADDTLPPVVAFNARHLFPHGIGPLPSMLVRQGAIFKDAMANQTRGNSVAMENQARWKGLLEPTRSASITPSTIIREPMLTTLWHQESPYNGMSPQAPDLLFAPTVAGCGPLALAQILNYHQWPVAPACSSDVPKASAFSAYGVEVSKDYATVTYRDTSPIPTATMTLRLDFPYDWDSILDSYSETPGQDGEMAVARLLQDCAVLLTADFDLAGTGVANDDLYYGTQFLLHYLMGYDANCQFAQNENRNGTAYTNASKMYARIRTDMLEGRPALVCHTEHAFVADGLAQDHNQDYYHFNYGWGGAANGWYLLTDGYEETVISAVSTGILPAPIPVFDRISAEQPSEFTLSWSFPKRLTAEAFRLTAFEGASEQGTVISDTIGGETRSYRLVDQTGTTSYTLEALVNGNWQEASRRLTITVQETPAPLPEIAWETETHDGGGTLLIHSSSPLHSLAVTSSRHDILPDNAFDIAPGEEENSFIVMFNANPLTGGALLLYVVARDDAGNLVRETIPLEVRSRLEELPEAQAIVKRGDFTFYATEHPWYLQKKTAYSSPTAMQSAAIDNEQASSLIATVSGAGDLSFFWRVSSEDNYDWLYLYVDGELVNYISGTQASWQQVYIPLSGMGEHVITWLYSKDQYVNQGKDCGWLDDLSFTPWTPDAMDSLEEAQAIVVEGEISFFTSRKSWFLQEETYCSAPGAMQSAAIGDFESSVMLATVNGPGNLSFQWMVSSELFYDYLVFYVDGTLYDAISGTGQDWQQVDITIWDEGEHILTWVYSKDTSQSKGQDCGWVDDIQWYQDFYFFSDGCLTYLITDEEATITKVEDTAATAILIPLDADGIPVVAIADNAFDGCTALTAVYMENETLGDRILALLGNEVAILPVPTPFRIALQPRFSSLTRDAEEEAALILGLDKTAFSDPAPTDTLPPSHIAFQDGDIPLSTDIRRFAEETTWPLQATLAPNASLTLDWSRSASGEDGTYFMPEEFTFTLQVEGKTMDMRLQTSITLSNPDADTPRTVTLAVTVAHPGVHLSLPVTLTPGWNLVGIPFTLDTATLQTLSTYHTLTYNPDTNGYILNGFDYTPGTAFWLFSYSDDTLELGGYETAASPALQKGLNLVSLLYGRDSFPAENARLWAWSTTGERHFTLCDHATQGQGYWLFLE